MMNSLVCVDASLIVRMLVPGPYSPNALVLLSKWSQKQTSLIAPALLAFEVVSVLRLYVYQKKLTAEEGEAALEQFMQMGIRLSHRRGIYPLAWDLTQKFKRPRAYDTSYLALAQMNDCEFWTADKKLYSVVKQDLPWVQWVAEYQIEEDDE